MNDVNDGNDKNFKKYKKKAQRLFEGRKISRELFKPSYSTRLIVILSLMLKNWKVIIALKSLV